MTEIGFEIHGQFYPFVGRDDWTINETRACRTVAGMPLDRLVELGDHLMINITFATAAWWRAHPEASESDALRVMGALKPGDWKWIGPPEDDASPPDETPGDDSSENTEPSSESTQEKSEQPTSGIPDSQPTGTSGPPNPSESSPTGS